MTSALQWLLTNLVCLDQRTILYKRVMIMKWNLDESKTWASSVQGLTSMVVLSIGAPTNPPRSLSTVEFNLMFLYIHVFCCFGLSVCQDLKFQMFIATTSFQGHRLLISWFTKNQPRPWFVDRWMLSRLEREADLVTAQERKLLMSTIYWDGRRGEEL